MRRFSFLFSLYVAEEDVKVTGADIAKTETSPATEPKKVPTTDEVHIFPLFTSFLKVNHVIFYYQKHISVSIYNIRSSSKISNRLNICFFWVKLVFMITLLQFSFLGKCCGNKRERNMR